jgi:hypothetical protein
MFSREFAGSRVLAYPVILVMLAFSTGMTLAQDDGSKDEPDLAEIERRVELLTEELERLRGDTVEEAPEEATTDGIRGKYGLAPSASKIYGKKRGLSFGGYGEWNYQNFDGSLDDGSPASKKDQADFLRLVMYTGYKFTDKILLNTELEYEHASTGKDGEVSVEFAYLDFFVRPEINVRTGMVLVPVGFVNEIHEPSTFLGVKRPDVETFILPTTWREVGAGVFGDVGPFSYRAYLTTSLEAEGFSAASGLRGGRQKGSKAAAEDLGWSGRVDYTGVPGLLLGVSAFSGGTGQDEMVAGSTIDGNVTTLDFHAEWRWRGLEVRGLWATVDVDDAEEISLLTGETIGSEMEGWYFQAGYDVLASTRHHRFQLIPFARVEEFDTQKDVAAALAGTVTGANDREVLTYGVVFKPHSQVAIKADFQDYDNEAGTGLDQFNVGVGFAF